MRRMVVEVLALALLALAVGPGWGQQSATEEVKPPGKQPTKKPAPPAKSSLEDMLAQALRNNPDLRVAATKLAEAEAKLTRTRLQVAQKVIALYHNIQTQRAAVTLAQKKYDRMKNLLKSNAIGQEILDEAEQALTLAKAKLAETEAELPYLLGRATPARGAGAEKTGDFDRWIGFTNSDSSQNLGYYPPARALVGTAKARVQGPVAERIRKALDTPVSASFKDTPLRDVLELFKKSAPGLVFQVKMPTAPDDIPVTGEFKDLPLGAALEWLQDSTLGDVDIVVREYGLLFVERDKVPPGAVTLAAFWKGGLKGEDVPARSVVRNAPSEEVEGLVKKVDEKSGLVTISIGSDAGLVKGHTLEVFRLKPTPKYLGTLRIVEVTPREAVGKPAGKLTESPKPGDRVASQLLGR